MRDAATDTQRLFPESQAGVKPLKNVDAMELVLFDLGETLFEALPEIYTSNNLVRVAELAGWQHPVEELVAQFATTRQRLSTEYAETRYYSHRLFIEDSLQRCLASNELICTKELAKQFSDAQCRDVVENLQPKDDCIELLEALRSQGLLVGIVSNIDDDWLQPLADKWQLAEYVDLILSSETAHSCKPDSAIFLTACKQLNVPPEQTVFIGDSELNDIRGAERVGMRTVLLKENPRVLSGSNADFEIGCLGELLTRQDWLA